MLKLRIFSIGKVKQNFVLEGEEEYLKRLSGAVKVELIQLSAARGGSPEQIKSEEAQALLKRLRDSDFLVVLDEKGKQMSSAALSSFLSEKMTQGVSPISFAIGGAFGWDDSVRNRADLVLSLSELTFPYQLTRLILIEQLYRAHSLLSGGNYHKA